MAENNASRGVNLVVEKLAEVAHIRFALASVDYGGIAVYFAVGKFGAFNRAHNVRKFTDAGGFYQNSVRRILLINFFKRLCKVADKRTANAPRVKFVYFYARVLQKTAVHAYFTELVFNKHKFFTRVSLFNKFFDKRSFARA